MQKPSWCLAVIVMYLAPADLASLTQARRRTASGLKRGGSLAYSDDRELVVVHHPLALAKQRIDAPVDEQAELGVFKPAPGLGVFFARRRGLAGRLPAGLALADNDREQQLPQDDAGSAGRVARRSPRRSRSTHGTPSFDISNKAWTASAGPEHQETPMRVRSPFREIAVKREQVQLWRQTVPPV